MLHPIIFSFEKAMTVNFHRIVPISYYVENILYNLVAQKRTYVTNP